MAIDPGPHDIDAMRFVLGPDGTGANRPVTADFYEALDRDFGDFHGHVLIQQFRFDAPWPTWEVHPKGDEFVCLIEGDADLVLWEDGAERALRVCEPGSYVVVPRGAWHTVRPYAPTTLLFVTPGEGTRNADRPG